MYKLAVSEANICHLREKSFTRKIAVLPTLSPTIYPLKAKFTLSSAAFPLNRGKAWIIVMLTNAVLQTAWTLSLRCVAYDGCYRIAHSDCSAPAFQAQADPD